MRSQGRARSPRGFTLIELLVVIAIIAVLVGVLLPALAIARTQGQKVKDLAAIRTLASAHTAYAYDRRDALVPGEFDLRDPMNPGQLIELAVIDEFGETLTQSNHPLAARRWTLRVGEYLDYQWEGSVLSGRQAQLIEDRARQIRSGTFGAFWWNYALSVAPSFGMNHLGVGGNYANQALVRKQMEERGGVFVTRLDRAFRPDRLISFASAHLPSTGQGASAGSALEIELPREGYLFTELPGLDDRFDATRAGDSFGRLHLRYNGDAIAVHLDGHAESFDETDLLDATRWFDKAARLGDPGWRLDLFRN